jgi:hypothetical protein
MIVDSAYTAEVTALRDTVDTAFTAAIADY